MGCCSPTFLALPRNQPISAPPQMQRISTPPRNQSMSAPNRDQPNNKIPVPWKKT